MHDGGAGKQGLKTESSAGRILRPGDPGFDEIIASMKTCLHCGDPFTPRRDDERFCSETCRAKASGTPPRPAAVDRPAPRPFRVPPAPASPARTTTPAAGKSPRRYSVKACQNCLRNFQPHGPRQRYCDDCKSRRTPPMPIADNPTTTPAAGNGAAAQNSHTETHTRGGAANRPQPARNSERTPVEGEGGVRGRAGLEPAAPVQAKARPGGAPASAPSVSVQVLDQGDGPLKLVVTTTCEIELTGELLAQVLAAAAHRVRAG